MALNPPTPTDGTGDPGRSLVRPFPEVGPLMRVAYRELGILANGSEQQIRALGDPARLPRPWDPATCRHPDLRAEVLAWLEAVVEWVNHEHVWDAAAVIPPCWPHHPHLVRELAVLADQRRRAGAALTSDLLEDWHRSTLPGFLDRMRARLRNHCDEGHQAWPAKGRHIRHTERACRAERAEAFTADVNTLDEQSPDAPHRAFSVVDLATGEIHDERTL